MDAAAGIRPCEIDVTLGGVTYVVPALPAADWIIAIIGEPGALLPGLLSADDQREIYHRILRGTLDVEEINTAWRALMTAATGRSWWSATRLCNSAADPQAWPNVHGRLLTAGIDLDKVSIGAFCNAVFFMIMTSSEDDAERSRHQFELELVPAGYEADLADSVLDDETNAENFMAAIAQLQQFG